MKRSLLLSLAAASLLACAAHAATRPAYGGTLRLEVVGTLASIDPTQGDALSMDAALRSEVTPLLFDTLVHSDGTGRLSPQLALSWTHDADFRRWQFVIRPGVKLHNGDPLTVGTIVASLAAVQPSWRVHLLGENVVIESESPTPNLPHELARARYAVVARTSDGTPAGTGPFRLSSLEPGKRLLLRANEDYWAGRPYLDAIEITFGRSYRDQAIDLQADRADVIEVPVDQLRRPPEDARIVLSQPVELLAIVFAAGVKDPRLRELVSASIDRNSIASVLLQKQGEPAGGLLPSSVSGYAFLFPTARNEQRLQPLRAGIFQKNLTLAYDWSDPVAKAVAERISVNAQDSGLTVRAFGENLWARGANADMRLVRIPLPSSQPSLALAAMASALGHADQAQQIASATTPQPLYTAERALVQEYNLVPLAYVPEAHAVSRRVQNWAPARQGGWSLDNVSLSAERP